LSAVALVPVTAGLMVFGPSFTTVVLVGHYSHNARLTGVALAFGAFGLLPFALVMLQQRVFYAMRDTRTPTLINVAMVATKVILVIVAGQVLSGRNVIIALTVSTSLSYVAGAIAGHILLRRRFGPLGFTSVARTVGWIAIAAVTGALAGLAVLVGIGAVLGSGRTTALVQLVLGCAVGIAVLAAAASRLPLTEVQDVLGAIRGRRASRSAQ
jgi:putative peptidoglycan lipid II flippase